MQQYQHLTDREIEDHMVAALHAQQYDLFTDLAAYAADRNDERRRRLTQPAALASAAAWYASVGIAVFPLRPGDKRPYPGSRGFKDATTDADRVRAWWKDRPDSNIGLPTGALFDVIDIDGPDGVASRIELERQGAMPHILGVATTVRDHGRHLYVPVSGDGNGARILPGIDYRGIGGYVVAPPSVVAGRHYEWIMPLDLAAARAVAA